ncbi:alpha/beta hydrolase [Actinoplanes subtropicus]|uniref:alpha/beta hydrolase n=1 Tax=Actinoplanes subtropicus TaxID=543632 RepID=UPI0004C43A5A|nr:alpha/beta hydrolase-fold protein [Actinoplanes subtropicus]
MQPDSQAIVLLAIALAVLAPIVLAVGWSRVRGRWRVPIRVTGVLACLLTAGAAGAFWVNSQVEAVTTWSRLFGSNDEAAAASHHDDGRGPGVAHGGGPGGAHGAGAQGGGAQGGGAQDGNGRMITVTVAGPASKITMPMYAYLPPGYDTHPTTRYPVIEAFHGIPGGPLFWMTKLGAPAVLDHEIKAGRMTPTVVLFPYQTPDPALDTECTNMAGGPQAETYLTQDVPAFAAANLHVRSDPGSWGLIGFSAGGYCATDLLLRHPAQYAAGASLSGYPNPGINVGDGSEHTTYNELWRLTHLPQPAVALYLACGKGDKYAMHGVQTMAKLVHAPLTMSTAYVSGGGHNTATWRAMEAPAFDWLSTWLGQPSPTTPAG